MQRRQFFAAGLAGASGIVAAPAIAQSNPEITWRLASSFPSYLDALYGGAETFARAVAEMTDNRFRIETHPAGEIVPALEVFDAVGKGTIDCAHTAMHYHWGIEPALVFATGVPFGMNAREQDAFFKQGGGNDLFNEILFDHKIYALPAGNTGCQMGGWFRTELRGVADLNGLKFRISGLAGKVLQKLGTVPTAASRSDISDSLEKGALDAAAWVSPYDDERLNLPRVAPFYYYPGWWQGSNAVHVAFNLDKWNALPRIYQAVLRSAAAIASAEMQSRYDAGNPAALKRLVAAGAKLRAFPQDMMDACWQATTDVFRESAQGNAGFARVQDAYLAFRNDAYLWWQVAEYPYDNFVIRQRAKG